MKQKVKISDSLNIRKPANSAAMETFLTIDELAILIKTPKNTIYKWTSLGEIPSYKIGRKLLFNPSEINKWMKRKKTV